MLRVVFMGTPEFAVPTLAGVVAAGHQVVAVYTQPPRPAGRGMAERTSAVHRFAADAGLAVLTPSSLKGEEPQRTFAAHQADAGVVVAYGLLLPKAILTAPREGCLNLHASALPRWRGAAPIQRAIMAGDTRTGVMVMRMEEGLDTGPVGLVEEMPIGPDTTAGELHDRMMLVGADLMGRALAALERGSLDFTPQEETGATYARKIEKAEARIDWSRPAPEVHNHIRGLSPFPGAWFELARNGTPIRIKAQRSTLADGSGAPGSILDDQLTIACGKGAVRLTLVQREGKGAMDAPTFLRGAGNLPPAAG
jgi:methionyl-tRNA formyltransferase